MARKIENIFNECIERIEQGESIEHCLMSYPGEAAELEPLLRTALGVKMNASYYDPSRYVKSISHARLDGAQRYARYVNKKDEYPAWQRVWVPALASITAVLFIGVGTVAASSNALPEETLYPVKMAAEKVRVAFTFSDIEKAKIHVELAEERSDEIAAMAATGNTEQIVKVTDELLVHLEKANVAIGRVTEDMSILTTTEIQPAPEEPSVDTTPPADIPRSEQPAEIEEPEPSAAATEPAGAEEPEPSAAATEPAGAEEPEPSSGAEQVQQTESEGIESAAELARILEYEQFRNILEMGLAKNVAVLQNALDRAPVEARSTLQHAIEVSNQLKKETEEPSKIYYRGNRPVSTGVKNKAKNTELNTEQNVEQNTEQNTEQNAEQNVEQSTEQNTEQNTELNTEQNTGENSEQNTDQDNNTANHWKPKNRGINQNVSIK
jgi:hypothetical protein